MKLLAISLLISYIYSASASSTNYNYNVYRYDMAPTFTPDGRILQVEYASAAAELSLPIVALQVDKETLVLLTLKNSRTPQNRIILLPPLGVQGDNDGVPYPIVGVAMSGVLADSIALIQVGLKEASKRLQQLHTPITVLQLATAMANACQSHCFGGGIRPYGCTLLTCGFNTLGDLVLYQTDPSGALLEVRDNDPSRGASSSSSGPFLRWMTGGSTTVQRKIRKRLESSLHKLPRTTTLLETLTQVGHTLIKETQKLDPSGEKKQGATPSTILEVVVMNRKLGCYRLSQSDIDSMTARI